MNIPTSIKIMFIFLCLFFGIPGICLIILGPIIGSMIPVIFGLVMSACGWIPLYIVVRKRMIKKRMQQYGELVDTVFIDIHPAYYDLFGWRPYIITSQWHDTTNNLLYHFKSPALNRNPEHVMQKGMTIPVYIDYRNPKIYYMDLNHLPHIVDAAR